VSNVREILILGSGAAGYTAGIYAARAQRRPLILGGIQVGGQLTITTEVENYPGFATGIQGPELMEAMKTQAIHQGAEVVEFASAEKVDFSRRPFRVWTDEGTMYEARAVIVATGATAKLLGIEGEDKYMGYGVSACATCDGTFFKDRRTVVVGGGDTALEEATYLSRLLKEVVVVHRRETLRASKAMQERALRDPKVRFVWDHEVTEVLGNDKPSVTGVKLRNVKTGEIMVHPTDSLFVAIGHKPNTDFLAGQLPMDSRGYLKIESGSTRTQIPGIFAAGDVADPLYRQAVTAAGTGCMSAIDAEHFLAAEDHKKRSPEAAASGARSGH
jgi:thioredoxin reductase (NADPH)